VPTSTIPSYFYRPDAHTTASKHCRHKPIALLLIAILQSAKSYAINFLIFCCTYVVWHLFTHTCTTRTTILWPFFRHYPGQPVPDVIFFLDFYGAREDNRGRHADHPDGRHSIQANQQPTFITHFYARCLLGATLPLYPAVGQAPNMHTYGGNYL